MTAARTIFLDECGHTGEDLADRSQPVFVVASHDLSEDEASVLKQTYFAGVKADELKHSSLQRRASHRAAIIEFLSHVLPTDRAQLSMAHKQYALVAKIVDLLIEPVMYRDGIDLYDRGGHDALSNVLYLSLAASSEALLLDVTRKFQRAVRTRNADHIQTNSWQRSSTERRAGRKHQRELDRVWWPGWSIAVPTSESSPVHGIESCLQGEEMADFCGAWRGRGDRRRTTVSNRLRCLGLSRIP